MHRGVLLLIAVSALALMPGGNAAAEADYELFGTIDLRSAHLIPRSATPAQLLSGRAEALLNQRLWLPDGELFGRSFIVLDASDATPRHVLQEGYLRLFPQPAWELSLGRQRINWGTGYTYSVTDALHPRSVVLDREVGFDGAALILYPAPSLTLSAALALQDAFALQQQPTGAPELPEALRAALYTSWYSGNLELAASLVHQYQTILRPGVSASVVAGAVLISAEAALEFANRLPYPGADFNEQEAEKLLYNTSPSQAELDAAGVSVADFGEPFPLASLAAEYSLIGDDLSATLIGEYLFNGLGYTQTQWKRVLPLLDRLSAAGEQTSSGFAAQPFGAGFAALGAAGPRDAAGSVGLPKRHYLFVTLSLGYRDSAGTDHRVLVSLTDGSVLVGHEAVLTTIERVDLGAEVGWAAGGSKHEFGLLPFYLRSELYARVHL